MHMPCFDPTYSTIRMITSQRPEDLKELPTCTGRVAEGGLRTRGMYKSTAEDKPLLSIIVVVLDRAYCFESCIQSILGQSYDNVEFIVIDGGSKDGTLDILQNYSDKIDYWVSEPDQGLYYAMNKAVEIASGDWLYFIGSDDVLLPDCLPAMAPYLKCDSTIYYGNVYGTGRKRVYNGPFTRYHISGPGIKHQGMFFPKKVFTVLRYDVSYKIGADWDLSLRCLIDLSCSFIYVPELIAAYNDIDGLSNQEVRRSGREYRTIIRRRLGLIGLVYICRWALIHLLDILHVKEPLRKLAINSFGYSRKPKERLEIAQRLLQKGINIDSAAKAVNLSVEELQRR